MIVLLANKNFSIHKVILKTVYPNLIISLKSKKNYVCKININ